MTISTLRPEHKVNSKDHYEAELADWIELEKAAVELIHLTGNLWFDKSVELVLFRNQLVDRSDPLCLDARKKIFGSSHATFPRSVVTPTIVPSIALVTSISTGNRQDESKLWSRKLESECTFPYLPHTPASRKRRTSPELLPRPAIAAFKNRGPKTGVRVRFFRE